MSETEGPIAPVALLATYAECPSLLRVTSSMFSVEGSNQLSRYVPHWITQTDAHTILPLRFQIEGEGP